MARPGAYLQLMRPVNLGILLLMQLLILGKGSGWNMELLRIPECLLLALAVLCTAAAGNVINDLHDTATDAINKPVNQLIPGVISRKQAAIFYALLLAFALLAAWFVELGFFLFCAAVSLLLYFYTLELKGIPLAGNILIALLTAAAVFCTRLGLYDTTLIPFAELSSLAFFVNLSREMVKDIEDHPGDAAAGIQTFVVRYGSVKAYRFAALLLLPSAMLAVAPLILGFENIPFRLHYALAAILLLWISIAIYRTNVTSVAKMHSKRLKLALLWGLLGILWL
jgi:4-hydroxybenzoate polyprenyltransferase